MPGIVHTDNTRAAAYLCALGARVSGKRFSDGKSSSAQYLIDKDERLAFGAEPQDVLSAFLSPGCDADVQLDAALDALDPVTRQRLRALLPAAIGCYVRDAMGWREELARGIRESNAIVEIVHGKRRIQVASNASRETVNKLLQAPL